MNIFNSLGSNYNLEFALKALFSKSDISSQAELKNMLEERYKGKAVLFYKGREAIEFILKLLNLPKNSSIAINGFTCYAVYEAIVSANCKVEYIDISDGDLNFTGQNLRASLKKNNKIKAVIIQNTLGYPCSIEEISKICRENNLILIEDLAHCIGAKYENGQEVGTLGDFVALSFSQDKMIDAVSAGALIIRNKKYQNIVSSKFAPLNKSQQNKDRLYPILTLTIRSLYQFRIGKILHSFLKKLNLLSKPVDSQVPGKLHELPAWYSNLVIFQLKNLKTNLEHRRQIATTYNESLNSALLIEKISKQISLSSNLRFPIIVQDRKNLLKRLKNYGVFITDTWYDAPIAPKKYLLQTDYNHQCPTSESISAKIINLPTHASVSVQDAKIISDKINQWLKLH